MEASGDDPEMKQIMQEEEEWTYKAFDNAVNGREALGRLSVQGRIHDRS